MGSITTCGSSFFGPEGDTRWNQRRLQALHDNFDHHELDVRDRQVIFSQVFAPHSSYTRRLNPVTTLLHPDRSMTLT